MTTLRFPLALLNNFASIILPILLLQSPTLVYHNPCTSSKGASKKVALLSKATFLSYFDYLFGFKNSSMFGAIIMYVRFSDGSPDPNCASIILTSIFSILVSQVVYVFIGR